METTILASDTGARMESNDEKPRHNLISPLFLTRLAKHLGFGARKYGDRNWENGMSFDRTIDSLMRHVNAYREGLRDEDHLAAVACNVMFLIHYEEMIRRGMLPVKLLDMKRYVPEDE